VAKGIALLAIIQLVLITHGHAGSISLFQDMSSGEPWLASYLVPARVTFNDANSTGQSTFARFERVYVALGEILIIGEGCEKALGNGVLNDAHCRVFRHSTAEGEQFSQLLRETLAIIRTERDFYLRYKTQFKAVKGMAEEVLRLKALIELQLSDSKVAIHN